MQKIQIERIQTKNKAVFTPDKAHKQNLLPHQHKVCAPIWNISHIVSSLLHCGLPRKDQCSTDNQRLVRHLLQSNCQWKEQLGQCPNLMECQTELDPCKPFPSVFSEVPRRAFDASRLVLDLVVCLIFSFWVSSMYFCKVNSLFSLLFHHEDLASGSGLAQGWYLMMRASAEVKGEKLTELNDGWSLVSSKQDGSQEQYVSS